MIPRIVRLTRAELLKLFNQPFFFISVGLLVAATILGAWGQTAFSGAKETAWHHHNALQIFAYGSKLGLKMASFILVIFGSMLFAGEFDRGTIKILLTRPITRTELFTAKCFTGLFLGILLFATVLAVSFGMGCLKGDLGPVWDQEHYVSNTSYGELTSHAWKAITISFPSILTAVFLGIMISAVTDSSGFAVAFALTLYIGLDLALGFLSDQSRLFFNYYPSYAFETLGLYASGSATKWIENIDARSLYLTVPGASVGFFTLVAYIVFRFRNILV